MVKIRGVVVDEHAHRIAGALVLASRGDTEAWHSTRTDDHGYFAFELEADDEDFTHIRAHANGRTSETAYQPDDSPGGRSLTIEVVPTVTVRGHVTDRRGRPVHGAIIAGADKETTTDACGGYRLKGLRPGTHQVQAWRNGLQLQTASIVVHGTDDEDHRLDWTLQPAEGRSIRFTLSEETPADVRPHWWLSAAGPVLMHIEGEFPDAREFTLRGLPTHVMLHGGVSSPGLQAEPWQPLRTQKPRQRTHRVANASRARHPRDRFGPGRERTRRALAIDDHSHGRDQRGGRGRLHDGCRRTLRLRV